METVSTQVPSATAWTVVPVSVQTPAPVVRVQVIAPLPVLPELLTVAL
jgi:hypothetical protein